MNNLWKMMKSARTTILSLLLILFSFHAVGANDKRRPNLSMFDTSAPGISANIQERVCVIDFSSDPGINALSIQSDIMAWLNESDGWEMIGGSKIDFVADCSNPNIRFEFHDITDPAFNCSGLACAPYLSGTPVSVYGYNRFPVTATHIGAQYWTCNNVPPGSCINDKKRVINHEMGHMLSLDHDGPVAGITSNLAYAGVSGYTGLYEKPIGERPVINEAHQARAQLNGLASPALHACVGFPSDSQVLVSWFDTARDRQANGDIAPSDNSNRAVLFKYDNGWLTIGQATIGAVQNIGSRANFLFNVGSVGGNLWSARADVIGGHRNEVNWDPALFSSNVSLSTSIPNTPCTFALKATGSGNVSLTWKDGSHNETEWHIYYALSDQYGSLGLWQYRGACTGANIEGCGDSASYTSIFWVGAYLCARIVAGNSNGISGYSNSSCVRVQ